MSGPLPKSARLLSDGERIDVSLVEAGDTKPDDVVYVIFGSSHMLLMLSREAAVALGELLLQECQ